MALRTECVYNGKKIGIESIFYISNGKQINIPDKLEVLRRLGREKQLFCPCNCGANLIVVAGERMQKEQHFRLHPDNADNPNCSYKSESAESINNKMIIMGWLKDKLPEEQIETRIPIRAVSNSTRKFEFSFLCTNRNLALVYSHDSNYLTDEKLECFDAHKQDKNIIYIFDSSNMNKTNQYPEYLMKVQDRQEYCLFLSKEKATNIPLLTALFYFKDLDGLWHYSRLCFGKLDDYSFNAANSLLFKNQKLADLLSEKNNAIHNWLNTETIRRAKEAEEQERKALEEKQRLEEFERIETIRKSKLEAERKVYEAEERKREQERINLIEAKGLLFDQNGRRIYKCRECGFVGRSDYFSTCGGVGKENEGLCDTCFRRSK